MGLWKASYYLRQTWMFQPCLQRHLPSNAGQTMSSERWHCFSSMLSVIWWAHSWLNIRNGKVRVGAEQSGGGYLWMSMHTWARQLHTSELVTYRHGRKGEGQRDNLGLSQRTGRRTAPPPWLLSSLILPANKLKAGAATNDCKCVNGGLSCNILAVKKRKIYYYYNYFNREWLNHVYSLIFANKTR